MKVVIVRVKDATAAPAKIYQVHGSVAAIADADLVLAVDGLGRANVLKSRTDPIVEIEVVAGDLRLSAQTRVGFSESQLEVH